ncbi:hypothetical protein WA026_014005 [Henosepilachna vigintioctopunctata]|uniref:Uncharacterized protein n=1 Tax=Henosepilachna vigintioctopunctata TaxID=420089 RepID=A0AAW1TYE7_9CUCU
MWSKYFLVVCSLVCIECMDSMVVKRSGYADQAVSASGYSYQADGNGPISYSSYRIGSGDLDQSPVRQFWGPRAAGIQPTHLSLENRSPFPVPFKIEDGYYSDSKQGLKFGPWKPFAYSMPYINYHNYGLYGYGPGIVKHHKYGEGSGSKYDESQNAAKGSKGEEGYKNREEYDSGNEGEHLEEKHKGHYAKGGAKASSDHDEAGYSASKAEAAEGKNGESFSKSDRHKKGSKTTGFHKVYHKDEYKKDHSFYDEKDSSGHQGKYEKGASQYGKESAAFEKGGHSKKHHDQSNHGAEGYLEKGRYAKQDKGHREQQGDVAYHKNDENYAKNNGHNYQDKNEYEESDEE